MARSGSEGGVGEQPSSPYNDGAPKKNKTKGAPHACNWDALDNPDVVAEAGWKEHNDEYWSYKTVKQYVKMYHIGKYWPRDQHVVNTKSFTCKPWLCQDDHFLHRAEEVWRAMFGTRPKSKGVFNYSVLAMVYVELKLERRVDWSTFPTTTQFPSLLVAGQRDIPDLYDPSSARTKEVLLLLKKVPNASNTPSSSRAVDIKPRATHLPATGLEKLEDEVENKGNDGGVQSTTTTFTPPRMQVENLLPNPSKVIEIEDPKEKPKDDFRRRVHEALQDLISVQPSGVEHLLKPKNALPLGDAGPSNRRSISVQTANVQDATPMTEFSNDQEVEKGMPSIQFLEELSELQKFFKEMMENVEMPGPNEEQEQWSRAEHQSPDFIRHFVTLRHISASLFAHLVPAMQVAKYLNLAAPDLVQCIRGLEKMTETFIPIIRKVQYWKLKFEKESSNLEEAKTIAERALGLVKTMQRDGIEDIVRQHLQVAKLLKEIDNLKNPGEPSRTDHEEILEESLAPSDKLSLSQDGVYFTKNVHASVGGGSNTLCIRDQVSKPFSTLESKLPSTEDEATTEANDTLDALKDRLVIVTRERDEAQTELAFLKKNLSMKDCKPRREDATSWLSYAQQLQDVDQMVNMELQNLLKHAATTDMEGAVLNWAAIRRYKTILDRRLGGPTEFTVWGDIHQMMHRTNHFQNDKSGHVDWALEIEEGWMPYNVFSSHLLEKEKKVVHTCDPAPDFLQEKCCLCQNGFGPEGAIRLGQCPHTFHIMCIAEHCVRRSMCPECRSPINIRFYEMMGLRHVMPSGHEYNQWNLPLDQAPKKFSNFNHWGQPLTWDVDFKCHDLYHEFSGEIDPLFWMTQDYEVELRARAIENDADREVFCRNFGGHWSVQHKRFFRFPKNEVEKRDDNSWHEVNNAVYGEEYSKYDRTLIGRALVLSKLEEAARLRATTSEDMFVDEENSYADVAGAFDKRINDVIDYWRGHMQLMQLDTIPMSRPFVNNEGVVDLVVGRVNKFMQVFLAKEVDLKTTRKGKRKRDSDDNWEPSQENEEKKLAIDSEIEAGGRITHPSQRRCTRSTHS